MINIWAWPIDVTVRDSDKRIDFYYIKDAYLIAETDTSKLWNQIVDIKLARTVGGQYLTWIEEDYDVLRSVRICSHTEWYDDGNCYPCSDRYNGVAFSPYV